MLGDKGFGLFQRFHIGVSRLEAGSQLCLGKQVGKGQHPLHQLDMAGQLGGGRFGLGQLLVAFGDGLLQLALLGLFGLHFRFRVGAEGDIQMLADKVAEVTVEAVVLLLLEGGLGVTLDQLFALKVELFDPLFPGGAAKQRQLGVAGETHLTLAGAHQHGVTQLVGLHQILVKGVGVALDEVDILRAIFQLFQPLDGAFEIEHHQGAASRAIECGVVRGIVDGDVVVDIGEQHAPHLLGNACQARICLASPQLQVANLQLQRLFLRRDAVALLLELALLVEHALHAGRKLFGGGERQPTLLAQLLELLEGFQPARGKLGQLRDIAAELSALMLEAGAALIDFSLLLGQLLLTGALGLKKQLQLVLARDQLARGLLQLVTQLEEIFLAFALFLEASQRGAQPLPLRDAGLVFDMTLEQCLGGGPGSLASGFGGNVQKQRQRRFVLGHRRLGQRQLLLGPQHPAGEALLGGAELVQGVARLFGGQPRQLALLAGVFQRLHRLTVLDGTGLLDIQRLLIVGQLGLEAVYLCLGQLLALLNLQQLAVDLLHYCLLLFEFVREIRQIGAVHLDLLLQCHGGHHLGQVLGGGLQLVGQQLLAVGELFYLVGQIDSTLLLFGQQATLAGKLLAGLEGQLGEAVLLGGVAHIVGRHIVGGLGNEVLEQIPLALGLFNSLKGAAVLIDGRLHVLECLAHPGVLRQQVFAQGSADGRRDTAIEGGLDQAVELAAILLITQLLRGDAELEHEVVIVGHRIELGDLDGAELGRRPLQIGKRTHPPLAVVELLQQQIGGRQIVRHIHQRKRGDVDLVVTVGHLLQVHADPDPLLTAVHYLQQRIAVSALQLAVEPLVTGGAG